MYYKTFILFLAFVCKAIATAGDEAKDENLKLFSTKKAKFLEMNWPNKFPDRRFAGTVTWDTFYFTFYSIRDEDKNCAYHGVSVALLTDKPDHFHGFMKLRVGCQINPKNLGEVLRKTSDDTLVYLLKEGKCYKATYKYVKEPKEEVQEVSHEESKCEKLPGDTTYNNARYEDEDELA